jgi:hypothetical protein
MLEVALDVVRLGIEEGGCALLDNVVPKTRQAHR